MTTCHCGCSVKDLFQVEEKKNTPLFFVGGNNVLFDLDPQALQTLLKNQYETFALTLPDKSVAQLQKTNIFSPDFKVDTATGFSAGIDTGLHYHGTLSGQASSVAISFFQNGEIIGNVSSDKGNFTLASPEGQDSGRFSQERIAPGQCFTPDDSKVTYSAQELFGTALAATAAAAPVRIVREYMETTFDIYQQKGNNVQNVVNFVTAIFSQSALIYANEQVPLRLSGLFVWDTLDPYTQTTTSGLLQQYRTTFNGDIGQLLGLKGGGGVAAGFDGYCNKNRALSQCYSGISLTFSSFPTYSWTVYVITHEAGHLLGCRYLFWFLIETYLLVPLGILTLAFGMGTIPPSMVALEAPKEDVLCPLYPQVEARS